MLLYLGNKLSIHGYTPTSVETLGINLQQCGEKVITASSKKNKILRLSDMLYLVYKYRKQDLLVLIDTYSTSAFWFTYFISKLCIFLKIPYISILRGGDLPARIDRSKKSSALIFNSSFSNIAVSEYMNHEFKKRNLPVQTIHNYIEIENYPFIERKNTQLKIIWVRAFHKVYNPQLAIYAFADIIKSIPEAKLTMVGPDKDGTLSKCEKLAKELHIDVHFTGKLTKKQWIELSSNHDLFLNTTNIDNTPVSVMEAMALGLPVVTTNAGGISYLFEDGKDGIMIQPDDKQVLVKTLINLYKSPDYVNKLSINARNKAIEWDWSIAKIKWCALINSALKRKL